MLFSQQQPSDVWLIVHDLPGFPDVDLFNNDGELIYADVSYVDPVTVRVAWAHPTAGFARLT